MWKQVVEEMNLRGTEMQLHHQQFLKKEEEKQKSREQLHSQMCSEAYTGLRTALKMSSNYYSDPAKRFYNPSGVLAETRFALSDFCKCKEFDPFIEEMKQYDISVKFAAAHTTLLKDCGVRVFFDNKYKPKEIEFNERFVEDLPSKKFRFIPYVW